MSAFARKSAVATFLAILACACSSLAERGRPETAQSVHLNHVYTTVDPLTAQAIRDSEYLRRFANLEVRTTTGTRATWTGRYLYGRETYVEFFGPEDFSIGDRPAPIGASGIALSGDRAGANRMLKARLEAAGLDSVVEMETRNFGGQIVPWFEALTAVSQHGDSGALDALVTLWAMEYQPSYFELPQAGKEPAEGSDDAISRERYQSDLYAERMMRDVTYVHLAVTRRDYLRMAPLLEAAGFRLSGSNDDFLADGDQNDIRFSLVELPSIGLRELRFSLNGPVERHVERIGRSTLTVGPGAAAVWTFD